MGETRRLKKSKKFTQSPFTSTVPCAQKSRTNLFEKVSFFVHENFFSSSSYPLIFLICRLISIQTGRSVQSERMRGTRSRGRQRRLNRRFIRRQFYGLCAERCRHGCVQFARRESARRYLEISLHQRENHVQTRDELPFNHDFGREQNRHRFQDV